MYLERASKRFELIGVSEAGEEIPVWIIAYASVGLCFVAALLGFVLLTS